MKHKKKLHKNLLVMFSAGQNRSTKNQKILHFLSILDHFKAIKKCKKSSRGGGNPDISGLTTKRFMCVFP